MNRWSEKLLVRRIVAGDHEACVQLIRLHHAPIYRLLVRLCRDTHLAEDLTQETFAAAWAGMDRFKGSSSLATWLHRIAYRKLVDARRRRSYQTTDDPAGVQDQICSHASEPLEAVLAEERGREVYRALGRLDPAHREAIVLHYLQGLSYREMAEVLDEPVGTVKGRVSEALAKLRMVLQETHEHEDKQETNRDISRPGTIGNGASPAAGAEGA